MKPHEHRRARPCGTARASLLEPHSDSPRLDAELLLGKVLGHARDPD